jgi:hypothetical protein
MTTINTTTATPTERQAMLIKLATRKAGVSRATVRDALGYGEDAPIPVQSILKQIASRFGYHFATDEKVGPRNRKIALYRFAKPTKKAAAKTDAVRKAMDKNIAKNVAKRAAKAAAKKPARKA